MIGLHHYELLDRIPSPGSEGDRYKHLRSSLPPAKSGDWKVEKFTIEKDLWLLRMMRDGRGTPPGEYTQLAHRGHVVMSDTNAEIEDLHSFFERAKGRVLIHGLGLGIALQGALANPKVKSVDVVELSADVIALVGSHFIDDRLTIHLADCRTKRWPRVKKWDVVWHDIWPDICGDNVDEMDLLRERFRLKCKWQGCWAERLARQG